MELAGKFLLVSLALACLAVTACVADSRFDLSPDDLEALCKVVDPSGSKGKPPSCMYMKWTPCPGGGGTPQRPCGWYAQTKCEDGQFSRKKRDLGMEEPQNLANHEPVFLSWPEE